MTDLRRNLRRRANNHGVTVYQQAVREALRMLDRGDAAGAEAHLRLTLPKRTVVS